MQEKNPWKKYSSRVAYQNDWMLIREDSVVRPDGENGIYAYMEKPSAVGIVALTGDNEVYLVGQYRYPTQRYSWEIIEGGLAEGEDPLIGAQRELREEAGVSASFWVELGQPVQISNCLSAELGHIFLAQDLVVGESDPDATEVLQIKKVSFADALSLVHSGEISDAFSIIGILRAQYYLEQRGS